MLDNITPQIAKTVESINKISAAPIEQVIGDEQINLAIQGLNQVTHRNALNSNDKNSASGELQKLSQKLSTAKKPFKALNPESAKENA